MDQRISFVTLAVADLDATRRFYVDGLGWEPALDVPGEVLMIKAGEHLVLSLWAESGFEAEVGTIRRGEGVVPITLAHNVRHPRGGRRGARDGARPAGADPVLDGVERDWGGYTGYFARPRRVPVGDRLEPRTDRAGRAAVSRGLPAAAAPR